MKANVPKRKIFDAVDMMTADTAKAETGSGLQSLSVDKIKPFHDIHSVCMKVSGWMTWWRVFGSMGFWLL